MLSVAFLWAGAARWVNHARSSTSYVTDMLPCNLGDKAAGTKYAKRDGRIEGVQSRVTMTRSSWRGHPSREGPLSGTVLVARPDLMRKQIGLFVTQQVQPSPCRKKAKACLGQCKPVFAPQDCLQLCP